MATACQGHLDWLHEGEGYRQGESHMAATNLKCEQFGTSVYLSRYPLVLDCSVYLTFRCVLCIGQAFRYSPEKAFYIQGGSNMTGTDLCVNKPPQSRSYLNHLVFNQQIYFII